MLPLPALAASRSVPQPTSSSAPAHSDRASALSVGAWQQRQQALASVRSLAVPRGERIGCQRHSLALPVRPPMAPSLLTVPQPTSSSVRGHSGRAPGSSVAAVANQRQARTVPGQVLGRPASLRLLVPAPPLATSSWRCTAGTCRGRLDPDQHEYEGPLVQFAASAATASERPGIDPRRPSVHAPGQSWRTVAPCQGRTAQQRPQGSAWHPRWRQGTGDVAAGGYGGRPAPCHLAAVAATAELLRGLAASPVLAPLPAKERRETPLPGLLAARPRPGGCWLVLLDRLAARLAAVPLADGAVQVQPARIASRNRPTRRFGRRRRQTALVLGCCSWARSAMARRAGRGGCRYPVAVSVLRGSSLACRDA